MRSRAAARTAEMSRPSRSKLFSSRRGRREIGFIERAHYFRANIGQWPRCLFSNAAQVVELRLCSSGAVGKCCDLDPDVTPIESNKPRLALERVSHYVERLHSERRELGKDFLLEPGEIRRLHERLDASSSGDMSSMSALSTWRCSV